MGSCFARCLLLWVGGLAYNCGAAASHAAVVPVCSSRLSAVFAAAPSDAGRSKLSDWPMWNRSHEALTAVPTAGTATAHRRERREQL